MRLRAHRRNPVWSPSVGPAHRDGAPGVTRLAHTRRIRRCFRIGALLAVIGLVHLARVVRPRWRPLLAGGVLTVVGVMLGNDAWGAVSLSGLLFLWSVLLIPASPDADRRRRSELERELAGYSTPAQRCDLEAILDRYPDSVTYELREILASQAMAAGTTGFRALGDTETCPGPVVIDHERDRGTYSEPNLWMRHPRTVVPAVPATCP
jgi:hypothetical protein